MSVSVPGHSGMGSSSASASASAVDDDVSAGGINGMTIKEILEKVDLFNVAVEDDDPEDPAKQEKVLVGKPKVLYTPSFMSFIDPTKGSRTCFILLCWRRVGRVGAELIGVGPICREKKKPLDLLPSASRTQSDKHFPLFG